MGHEDLVIVRIAPTRPIGQLQTQFKALTGARLNTEPLMEQIGLFTMGIFDKTFAAQGRRGGGSWTGLAPVTIAYKEKNELDPRILHRTADHPLRASLTEKDHPDNIFEVQPERVVVGTKVGADTDKRGMSYARPLNEGSAAKHIPARPFFKPTHADRKMYLDLISRYFFKAFKPEGQRMGAEWRVY